MAKKIGVILSGCGFQDGAEIQEAVLTLLALDRAGAEVVCMAPNIDQRKVVNHLTGDETQEKRNVLVESARITRGEIRDVAKVKGGELDGLVLPGGYGAALNLSDFAIKGPESTVHPEVSRVIREVFAAKKPIGAICIAPAVIARVLGDQRVQVTIGNDDGTAKAIERCGARHQSCVTQAIVIDEKNHVVSTPAYMLGPNIRQVATGIEQCVTEVMRWA